MTTIQRFLVLSLSAFSLFPLAYSPAQEEEKRDLKLLKDLVNAYVDRAFHRDDEKNYNLRELFKKYPKAGAKEITDRLGQYENLDDKTYDFFLKAILILRLIPDECAAQELDKLYMRFGGSKPYHESTRRYIIYAFRVNLWARGYNKIASPYPQPLLAPLEKWLKTEDSDYVFGPGLKIFSDYSSELPAEIIKNAKTLRLPESDIVQASRKNKINRLKDYGEAFQEVLTWMDDLVKEKEKIRKDYWEKKPEEIKEFWESFGVLTIGDWELDGFLSWTLHRDPKGLEARAEKVREKLKEMDKKIGELDKMLEAEKMDSRKLLLRLEHAYCDGNRRVLAQALKKD